VTLKELAVPVSPGDNRAVSFTNKQSAYYYTQTHRNSHPEHAWFRGLNIAGRRVFNDYHLIVDGTALDPAMAQVVVFPDALVRTYPNGVTETLRLFDNRDLVEVTLTGASGKVDLRLYGDQVNSEGSENGLDWYVSTNQTAPQRIDHIAIGHREDRFLIAVGPSREAATKMFEQGATNAKLWEDQRRVRLEHLINGDQYLWTDDPKLTKALRWITLTTDELLTNQRGVGIYAGLPWFNEYWGRDTFISFTGATLVTGQFETARTILSSFAQFQDMDLHSPFYGRVPNIVKPDSLDYHTTDATPRFVVALRDYVHYSGDRSIITELYSNILASIEGSFAHWTDSCGYLLHKDDETWMDARRSSDLTSYSPRSTRANDIQALWYEQLRAGAEFANTMGDTASAMRWTEAATQVREHFAHDFFNPKTDLVADHLTAENKPDFALRPNMLFALDLIGDEQVLAPALRKSWESLVFPWGVATLDPNDPFFHPYHLALEQYPKDEAYHNGTVWPWLNGIAIQRMIEVGQIDLAWPLFQNMNELTLERGVVGGLPETMDAYPRPGETWPRLTGTFQQAWSNAEQLRVWYQYVLGIRPEMAGQEILLAPRLPSKLGKVDFSVRVGAGSLHGTFDCVAGHRCYVYRLANQLARLSLDISPYTTKTFAASPGDSLIVEARTDGVHVRFVSFTGSTKENFLLSLSQARRRQQAKLDAVFRGTHFAKPTPLGSHPVLKRVASKNEHSL
jgi:glycogen debranching enzyme